MKIQRIAIAKRCAHVAGIITALNPFELNDLGTQIGKNCPSKGPGKHLTKL
jgi:hypothetical protein